jgi:CDP-diacylglycerol--serine O-phosphatidyltransferase
MVMGLIWVMDDSGFKDAGRIPWLAIVAWVVTFFAGASMVTNAPYYSFKDLSAVRSVPFIVIFALFCAYGVSGYVVYGYRKAKGQRTSVIATSTDEPEEEGLHR